MTSNSTSVPVDELPGRLPPNEVPQDVDVTPLPALVEQYLTQFSASHLTDDALWRDWLSMTGGVRTLSGNARIAEVWTKLSSEYKAASFKATGDPRVSRFDPATSWVDVLFTFNVAPNGLAATASGTASLVPSGEGDWKVWMITTVLESFDRQKHPDKLDISEDVNGYPNGTMNEIPNGTLNGSKSASNGEHPETYEVVIIGSGHHGLGFAGRLQALGIPYIVVERNPEVGDNWLNRYDSVRLHTPREVNELPFARTWSVEEPLYLPARNVADGHRRFVKRYHINVRTSTNVDRCIWDEASRTWTVEATSAGSKVVFKGKQVALATGGGYGQPKWPQWPGKDTFKGTLLHSTMYKNPKGWEGKRAVIIGTGTSAHDMARDMIDAGMSVTMVQRDKTAVFPKKWTEDPIIALYNDNIPTEVADRAANALPNKINRDLSVTGMNILKKIEHERFDALERVGFKVDREAQLFDLIYEKLGGYYLDVGTSALISKGVIKIKSGVSVKQYTPSGIALSNGTELPADILVVATGFEVSYDQQLEEIFGHEIAARAGTFWGLDKEGELRGILKHVGGVPLWLLGGGATQARWHSRFMALHVQAALLGKPLKQFDA